MPSSIFGRSYLIVDHTGWKRLEKKTIQGSTCLSGNYTTYFRYLYPYPEVLRNPGMSRVWFPLLTATGSLLTEVVLVSLPALVRPFEMCSRHWFSTDHDVVTWRPRQSCVSRCGVSLVAAHPFPSGAPLSPRGAYLSHISAPFFPSGAPPLLGAHHLLSGGGIVRERV